MVLSIERIKEACDAMPIGFYAGKRIPMKVENCPTSYADIINKSIVVSSRQINDAVKDMTTVDDSVMRPLLYHEVSHIMLSPVELDACIYNVFKRLKEKLADFGLTDSFMYDSGVREKSHQILNVFCDHRIETINDNVFMECDFKQNLINIVGLPKQTFDIFTLFYYVVRFGYIEQSQAAQMDVSKLVERRDEIVTKYWDITADTTDKRHVEDYVFDVMELYVMTTVLATSILDSMFKLVDDTLESFVKLLNSYGAELDDAKIASLGIRTLLQNAAHDIKSVSGKLDAIRNVLKDLASDLYSVRNNMTDYRVNEISKVIKAVNKLIDMTHVLEELMNLLNNQPQGQSNGNQASGKQSDGSGQSQDGGGSGDNDTKKDAQDKSDSQGGGQSDSKSSKQAQSQNASQSGDGVGDDTSLQNGGSGVSSSKPKGDTGKDSSKSDEKVVGLDTVMKRQTGEKTKEKVSKMPHDRPDASAIGKMLVKCVEAVDNDVKETIRKKLLVKTMRANQLAATHAYSGKLDHKAIGRDDWKIFKHRSEKSDGSKIGRKIHFIIVLDQSGSYSGNDVNTNKVLAALIDLEKQNIGFSFDVIKFGSFSRLAAKDDRRSKSNEGTNFDCEMFELIERRKRRDAINKVILLNDGEGYWENDAKQTMKKVIDNKDSVIICDSSYCTVVQYKGLKRAKIITTSNYPGELSKNVCVALNGMLAI